MQKGDGHSSPCLKAGVSWPKNDDDIHERHVLVEVIVGVVYAGSEVSRFCERGPVPCVVARPNRENRRKSHATQHEHVQPLSGMPRSFAIANSTPKAAIAVALSPSVPGNGLPIGMESSSVGSAPICRAF